jgi:5'-methylthioadenosine phosphorylase
VVGPQHIKAKKGEIAGRVVVSGDPARVAQLSNGLKGARLVNDNRGLVVYSGEFEGKEFTVACHGIGAPSLAIVVEELVMLGAKAIVRLGTCGGLLKPMAIGELVVATRATYLGGTLSQYFGKRRVVPEPDSELTTLLLDTARSEGVKCYAGPVFSSDAFYAEDPDFVRRWSAKGCVAVDMECATLFGLGMLRSVKTAGALVVSDNLQNQEPVVDARALRGRMERAGNIVFKSLAKVCF